MEQVSGRADGHHRVVTGVHCDEISHALMSSSHRMKTHSSPRHIHTAPVVRNPVSKRRSNRMGLSAAIHLSGEDRQKTTFNVPARASNLNLHGAAVQLGRDLPVGAMVVLRNSRGTELSARVVTQISAVEGVRTYGIEFVDGDERAKQFWGISFPSA